MTVPGLVHPGALWLLLAVPAFYWLIREADRRRASALRRFAGSGECIAHGKRNRAAPLAAMGLIALALAQPVWRAKSLESSGSTLDVVFLLDVSRSMSARDGIQSRLEQAKAAIAGILARAAHERFALVVFAGNASVECPLTNDYAFLRGQLKGASRDSVTAGGSRPGDAIRFAAHTAFDDASRNARELVLIGDGGDEGSSAVSAVRELEQRRIRLVVMGAGDERWALVPRSESDATPILYEGRPVIAKLDSAALRTICAASAGCMYMGAGEGAAGVSVLNNKGSVFTSGEQNSAPMAGGILALAAASFLAWGRRIR